MEPSTGPRGAEAGSEKPLKDKLQEYKLQNSKLAQQFKDL